MEEEKSWEKHFSETCVVSNISTNPPKKKEEKMLMSEVCRKMSEVFRNVVNDQSILMDYPLSMAA
jgi:hypothetical protein